MARSLFVKTIIIIFVTPQCNYFHAFSKKIKVYLNLPYLMFLWGNFCPKEIPCTCKRTNCFHTFHLILYKNTLSYVVKITKPIKTYLFQFLYFFYFSFLPPKRRKQISYFFLHSSTVVFNSVAIWTHESYFLILL